MNDLGTITEQDFISDGTGVFDSNFAIREASRAVLLDHSGNVYLMNVSVHGYHKLPGGGIDAGETKEAAMQRELKEEVGCQAEILAELGSIIEHRNSTWPGFERMKQISYCYLARQIGEQIESELDDAELAEGLVETKASSIQRAIELLSNDKPDNLEGLFIQKRDVMFLKAARDKLAATSKH